MSRKKTDMKAEHELTKFLDKYFYPKVGKTYNYKTSRVKSTILQIKGIDIIIKTRSKVINIDEKAQLYYINKDIPTFAFEVNFINRANILSEGWLINEKLLTDYYLLIWAEANSTDLNNIRANDFTNLDCLMISKSKIIEYLEERGWTKNRIIEKSKEIREKGLYKRTEIKDEQEFYFYYSELKNYSEQPINIVIRKERLITLADRRYNVTKFGVTINNMK